MDPPSDDELSDDCDSDGNRLSSSDSADSSSNDDISTASPERESTPPPEPNAELNALTAEVDDLCSQATQELALLPRKTRNKLALQTRDIFTSYEAHGSQQRLAIALERFLLAPDDEERLDYTLGPAPSPKPRVTRTIDPSSAPLVREMPFHATDLHLEISGDVRLPDFLLPSLDRIFGLYAAEARALLKHYTARYGDEAIFRAGIAEHVRGRLRDVLTSTGESELNISPETRRFLRSVYERKAVLNLAEKRMLARATRLGLETLELFWDDMAVRRRAWEGMQRFVAARELERLREEKAAEERAKGVERRRFRRY